MDRLQALSLAVVGALAACSPELYADPQPGKSAPGRVNAVQATTAASPESWCELTYEAGHGPQLTLPALAAESSPPALAAGRWTWLNLWATWCAPCVAEMDLMARWQKRLDEEQLSVDFWLVSLDDDSAAPSRFLATNGPQGPKLRAESIDALSPWLARFQLAAATPIPIHLLVAPGGEVRCVRVGAVSEGDWGLVRRLVAGR